MAQKSKGITLQNIRSQYTKDLVQILVWLSNNHIPVSKDVEKEYLSFNHITRLLNLIKNYRDNYFPDPFGSYLIAIFDSLIYKDTWQDVSPNVFNRLSQNIKTLNDSKELNYDNIDQHIYKLEELGLNPMPY